MKKGKVAPAKKKKENSIPFIPRRSRRVSIRSGKQNDGDTWIEHLHVYDPVTKENRSYFMSQNTKMCVSSLERAKLCERFAISKNF